MELWSLFILLIVASSKQIVLFSTFVSITNVLVIVVSTRIIKVVYFNGQSTRSMKCPVIVCFTCIFAVKMTLDQTYGPWILVMTPIFTIKRQMPRTFLLLIYSLELNFTITILNIFTCGVVLYMSWKPHFKKAVNSQNGSHNIFVGYLLE